MSTEITKVLEQFALIKSPWELAEIEPEKYLGDLERELTLIRDSFRGMVEYEHGLGGITAALSKVVHIVAFVGVKQEEVNLTALAQRLQYLGDND
jgi:hypothetical protein